MGGAGSKNEQGVCPYCNLPFPLARNTYDRHLASCHTTDSTFPRLRYTLQTWKIPWQQGAVTLSINRESVVRDSLEGATHLSSDVWRGEMHVDFIGERVSDAGGAVKEWLCLVNSHLLSPQLGLYKLTDTSDVSYRLCACLPSSHLPYLHLHGLILAKSLLEGIPIHCPLSTLVFKQILGHTLTIHDLQHVNSSLYNGLKYMNEHDITDTIYQTFSVTEGGNTRIPLCINGENMHVTEENKHNYIDLVTEWELIKATSAAVSALKSGFEYVIPCSLIQSLTSEELAIALCGQGTISLTEWRKFTEYHGEFNESHRVIQWFWSVLDEFTQQDLSLLLKFVMGTSRLPVEGFDGLRTLRGDAALFTIEPVAYTHIKQFPRAHTCFNRLDLPLYCSREVLKENLMYAIRYHNEGFGFE